MKSNIGIKLLCIAFVLCFTVGMLTACSGGKEMTVSVNDMGVKTEITAVSGTTVEEALKAAAIALGEKDETEPAKDTKLTEEITEITVKRYAKVTVVFGDDKKEVELVGGTVEDAVKAAALTTEDVTPDVPAADYLKDGMTINLVKGLKVSLTADGKTAEVASKAATVEDFLKEQGVTLGADDEVSAKLTDALTDGMQIVVKRVEYKTETVTETLDYQTEERYSDSMESGTSEVTQNGVEGEKEVTYKVKYVDGKEDSREVASEKVTKEAVNKIVTYGTHVNEVTIVSKQDMPDCDGSGHGYYIITYSDGTVDYEEY